MEPRVVICEPSPADARQRAAAALARREPSDRALPDDAAVRVARARREAAGQLELLAERFARAVSERLGRPPAVATTLESAAAAVSAAAGPGAVIGVNRAATLVPLIPLLEARGHTVRATYAEALAGTHAALAGRAGEASFLAPLGGPAGWSCREVSIGASRNGTPATAGQGAALTTGAGASTEQGRGRLALTALLGVTVAAADTGTLYFVQHLHNIETLLGAAARLVFVVALDKLLADDAAARLQALFTATTGAEATLKGLPGAASAARPGDPLPGAAEAADGAPAVTVIILDAGRRALASGRYTDLHLCTSCRACALSCPTEHAFRGPEGWTPKEYLGAHLTGRAASLDLCTYCGNCRRDCPLDIPVPALIAERRAEARRERGRGLRGWMLRAMGEVEWVSRALAVTPFSNRLSRVRALRRLAGPVTGLHPERPLPRFTPRTFNRWFRRRYPEARKIAAGLATAASPAASGATAGAAPAPARESASTGRSVAFFPGCFVNYNDPDLGRVLVELVERAGYRVLLPPWHCCGVPLAAKGESERARALARANLRALGPLAAAGCEIIVTCPSCLLSLVRDYPRLVPSAEAELVASRTRLATAFLDAAMACGELRGAERQVQARIAYHLPCHQRALGLEEDSVRLLRRVPGVAADGINAGCCGLSGTFGLTRDHYDLSMEVGGRLFSALTSAAPDLVATDCASCEMQIRHGTRLPVVHPLRVLAAACGVRATVEGAPGEAMPARGEENRN